MFLVIYQYVTIIFFDFTLSPLNMGNSWHKFFLYDIIYLAMEEYPSLVEGVGLENRKVGQPAQGFESLFLRQFFNIAGW